MGVLLMSEVRRAVFIQECPQQMCKGYGVECLCRGRGWVPVGEPIELIPQEVATCAKCGEANRF